MDRKKKPTSPMDPAFLSLLRTRLSEIRPEEVQGMVHTLIGKYEDLDRRHLQLFDAYVNMAWAAGRNERRLVYWVRAWRDNHPNESPQASYQAAADAISSGEIPWTHKSKRPVPAHTVSEIRSKIEGAGSRLRKEEWPIYLWYKARAKDNPDESEMDSKQATFKAIRSGELPYKKPVTFEIVCEIIDHGKTVHRWKMGPRELEKDREEWEERNLFRWHKAWVDDNPDADAMASFEAALNSIKDGKIQWSRKANLQMIISVVEGVKTRMLHKSK